MGLYLEIMSGDQKGVRVKLQSGMVIGRKEGLLTIRDSKLSGKHARIELKDDGSFWLVDLGSSNGIKLQDSRVRVLKMEPHTRFTLGRTQFLVVTQEDSVGDHSLDAQPLKTVTRTYWDQLRELSEQIASSAQGKQAGAKSRMTPFYPTLRLQFIRGYQTGTEWTLGYGPRKVGASSIDLPLENISKAVDFQILPAESAARGAVLKCDLKSAVRLNGKLITSAPLQNGDVIEIETTQIKVIFDE